MAAYPLDTNYASPLVMHGHPLRLRLRERLDEDDTFAICVSVLTETIVGIGLLPHAMQNQAEWARFRPLLPCYIPNDVDVEAAAELQLALRRQAGI